MDDATLHEATLHDVGELEALRRFLPLLPAGESTLTGPGDDAAVVAASDGRFVVTTDTMLEGADFRLGWSRWHDLGWKAVATNLIDVAAMGARPTSLVVALAVPPATRVSALEEFARGLADAIAAMAPGVGVVGGDLGTARLAVVAVSAFGDLEGRAPVLRSGATPGDAVWLVGALGLAATGLRHLFAEAVDEAAEPVRAAAERLRAGGHGASIAAQLAPVTPIGAGTLLSGLGATAMLDVSDGLALDAARVARASRVRIALDAAAVAAAAQGAALQAALHGGEDHALLVTLPAHVEPPVELAGHPVRRIGVVEAATPGTVTLDGEPLDALGWDPYRAG